jgi:PAS domain-containing protein
VVLALAGAAAWWLRARIARPLAALHRALADAGRRERMTEARLHHVWEHTPEGLFVVRVTPEGDLVFEGLNPAHAAATGLSDASS